MSAMTEAITFPEWATPGSGVLVVKTKYNVKSIQAGKVSRLTKTRIIVTVDTGSRQYDLQFVPSKYAEGQWSEYGRGSSWDIPAKLEPIDSAEAEALISEKRVEHLQVKASMACEEFRSKRTVPEAEAAIAALNAYIEAAMS